MAETVAPEPAALSADADEEAGSLFGELRDLAEDAQTAVEAEVHYQSARAGYALGEAKGIALWAVLALAAAIIALFALATGALLALAPVIGAWAATGLVVLVLLVVAGLSALAAMRGVKRIKRNAFPSKPEAKP